VSDLKVSCLHRNTLSDSTKCSSRRSQQGGKNNAAVKEAERHDATLLDAWREGDVDAGDELLKRHFVAVYRFFAANLSPSGRGADPEDLTQRTFEACIARRDRVETDFRAYLFGVARRQLYLEWKQRQARGEVMSPSDAGVRDVRTSPSAAVARLEDQKIFLQALERLPLEFRAVLELFFWEDRPIAAIAEELGIALGTVKSRLFRGKAMIGQALVELKVPERIRSSTIRELDKRTRALDPTRDPG
jgi:RNA polymerase sigma factor (sigma-70 family)